MEIITDVETLHRVSEKVNSDEVDDLFIALKDSIPPNGLGLAAIQLGIHKRAFLANLSIGSYVFINPKIIWHSSDKIPSMESCLSIPNMNRCIDRYTQITLQFEQALSAGLLEDLSSSSFRLKDMDAFIAQHEYDHLNGVIITDYPEVKTQEQRMIEENQKRQQRILKSRTDKKNKIDVLQSNKPHSSKKSDKLKRKIKKSKRQVRTYNRQEKIRVMIEKRYEAEKKDLLNQQNPTPETPSEGN